VDRLTLKEYELLMKAERLKQVDMDYRNHLQAFLNFAAKAEKKAGKNKRKPAFTRFEKFYNYKKALREAENPNARSKRLARFEKFLKEKGGEDDG